MPLEMALEELKRNRGGQFDPNVVDTIVALYEEGKLKPAHMPEPNHVGASETSKS
jgi:HD-GYP domain-containing protein (c-di-GMP phosphodiesterase class II)